MNKEAFLAGVGAVMLEKTALSVLPSWGGQALVTKRKLGLRGEIGYDYLLGTVPIPNLGISIGNENRSFDIGGPIPHIGFSSGLPSDYSGRIENRPRSLWKALADSRLVNGGTR